jgi:catechol 2,3-dioxygenase-like lactoylglutathione lyase family enzyme
MENLIERTDFVSVPVQNMERAKASYRNTLGLQSPSWEAGFPEIETGNLSLYLVDPTAMGMEFAPHTAHIARRVPDAEVARRELEELGVRFSGEHDTGVCKM